MKALTIRQPWASLIALGVKHIETRSWRAPQSLIGQTIAIHAGKAALPAGGTAVGNWCIAYARIDGERGGMWVCPAGERAVLPLGAVVATATLADCLPMVAWSDCRAAVSEPYPAHVCLGDGGDPARLIMSADNGVDIADQLPYGNFAPGRWAWMLTNVQPCQPIPAKGKQGLWTWEPVN